MAPKKAAAATGAKKAAPKESSHPAYLDMIKEAIITLKERNGSSRQEIKKYILANYKLEAVPEALFKSQVNRALSKGVSNGTLTQPKGPSGPVKLAKPDSKSTAKPAAKKVKAEGESKPKPAAKKAAPKKTAAATKAAPKKAATTTKAKANTAAPRKTAVRSQSNPDPADHKLTYQQAEKPKTGRVTKAAPKKAAATKKAPAKKAAPKKAAAKKA